MSFLQRTWNTGNLLVVVGFVVLGLTFVWPWVTSQRVARIEGWAEDISESLLATALAAGDAPTGRHLLESMDDRNRADRLRIFQPPAELPAGIYFEGKHYYYLITSSPVDTIPGSAVGFEVYAWPQTRLGPSRTAFYFAEGAPPTYSRNLKRRYVGTRRFPRAGDARPRESRNEESWYLDRASERWIDLPERH